jgi:hypothetical protein
MNGHRRERRTVVVLFLLTLAACERRQDDAQPSSPPSAIVPRVSEQTLIIRADPEAPYEVTQTLLERAAKAGFYRFHFGPAPPLRSHGP